MRRTDDEKEKTMLMLKDVAEVLGVSKAQVMKATRELANVGRKSSRLGILFSSDDIDRIKEYLGV